MYKPEGEHYQAGCVKPAVSFRRGIQKLRLVFAVASAMVRVHVVVAATAAVLVT